MSIASQITRLQGVKSDILQAISDKGVTVPAGSMLNDCPGLISDISTSILYEDYETDFSNFDFTNKIDIPKKGSITFYNNIYSFSTDVNGLKITAPSGNIDTQRLLGFYPRNGSELEFNFIFQQNSSSPSFIWFLNTCAFVCNTNEQNTVILLVSDQYNFTPTDKINYYGHDYGFYYYATSAPYFDKNIARLKINNNNVELFMNDEKLFDMNESINFTQLNYNPRNGKYIITDKIKFTY